MEHMGSKMEPGEAQSPAEPQSPQIHDAEVDSTCRLSTAASSLPLMPSASAGSSVAGGPWLMSADRSKRTMTASQTPSITQPSLFREVCKAFDASSECLDTEL